MQISYRKILVDHCRSRVDIKLGVQLRRQAKILQLLRIDMLAIVAWVLIAFASRQLLESEATFGSDFHTEVYDEVNLDM